MPSRRQRVGGYLAALLALCLVGALAALPWLRSASHTPGWTRSGVAGPVTPLQAPRSLPVVRLVASARPVNPDGERAVLPATDGAHQAALVAVEDRRLRTLLHRSSRLVQPTLISVAGNLPTLVLPARPAQYGVGDLVKAGALISSPARGAEVLVDSVLVVRGATLVIDGSSMSRLLMSSAADRFSSIVSWAGSLTIRGTAAAPLTITAWDRTANNPAADLGHGRSYLRAVGSRMDLQYVRIASLGFWSGRTGGVAWTGSSAQPSTGGAEQSTFTGNTYGAFLSHTDHARFTDDLFQSNELDGLRLHRYAAFTTVSASAAARNGNNGFVVDRGATGSTLTGDVSVNNGGNGYVLDGRALLGGLSPSGTQATVSYGTVLRDSDAERSGRTGILVEGGQATTLTRNTVCAPITAIALRDGATGSVLAGNDVHCGGRIALSIGPGVTGTTVTANTFNNARVGVLIRGAAGVRLVSNTLTDISVFGISIRGASPGVVGDANSISGHGFRPVDARTGATIPTLTNTDTSNWTRKSRPTVLSYLRYHPILFIWLGIIVLVALAYSLTRIRRTRPQQLYAHTFAPDPIRHATPAHAQHHPQVAHRVPFVQPELEFATAGAHGTNGHSNGHSNGSVRRKPEASDGADRQ